MSDLLESGKREVSWYSINDHCLEVSETFFYLSYITGAEGVAVVSVLARIKVV